MSPPVRPSPLTPRLPPFLHPHPHTSSLPISTGLCCIHTHGYPNLYCTGTPGPGGASRAYYPYNVAENHGFVGANEPRTVLDRTNLHVLSSKSGVLAWARGVPQHVADKVVTAVDRGRDDGRHRGRPRPGRRPGIAPESCT